MSLHIKLHGPAVRLIIPKSLRFAKPVTVIFHNYRTAILLPGVRRLLTFEIA